MDYGKWEPKIHDFEDDYHVPDEILYPDEDKLITNVRRRYKDYSDYTAAILLVESYMNKLLEKYGGLQNFKAMFSMGFVREYIPPMPTFKRTKRNEVQDKLGISFPKVDKKARSFEVEPDADRVLHEEGTDVPGYGMSYGFSYRYDQNFYKEKTKDVKVVDDEEAIVKDLELLQKYSQYEGMQIASSKKRRKSSKNLIKAAKQRRKELERLRSPKTLPEILDEFVWEEEHGEEESGAVYYKGLILDRDDFIASKLAETWEAAGFSAQGEIDSIRSKKFRKMVKLDQNGNVRKSKKERKKEKKMKDMNSEVSKEEFSEFLDEYDESDAWGTNFKAFEKEMQVLNSDQMRRDLDR